jgi:hypothetical protein
MSSTIDNTNNEISDGFLDDHPLATEIITKISIFCGLIAAVSMLWGISFKWSLLIALVTPPLLAILFVILLGLYMAFAMAIAPKM